MREGCHTNGCIEYTREYKGVQDKERTERGTNDVSKLLLVSFRSFAESVPEGLTLRKGGEEGLDDGGRRCRASDAGELMRCETEARRLPLVTNADAV
jgi:hypothetical protein